MLPSGSLGTLQTWDDRGEERALAQGPCAQHRVFGDKSPRDTLLIPDQDTEV